MDQSGKVGQVRMVGWVGDQKSWVSGQSRKVGQGSSQGRLGSRGNQGVSGSVKEQCSVMVMGQWFSQAR